MTDTAILAREFHDSYLRPRALAALATASRVRKAIVTVQAVNPNGKVGVAQVLFADGSVGVLPYGAITPSTSFYWRRWLGTGVRWPWTMPCRSWGRHERGV